MISITLAIVSLILANIAVKLKNMQNLGNTIGKLLLFAALIAIIFFSMVSCSKDEPLTPMRKAEPVAQDSTKNGASVDDWGMGKGDSGIGEG